MYIAEKKKEKEEEEMIIKMKSHEMWAGNVSLRFFHCRL